MNPFIVPIGFMTLVFGGVVVLNERYTLLSADRFATPLAKGGAYAWLGLFLFGVALLVTGAALKTPTAKELASTPFYRIFALHWILIVFLAVWWLLSGRPRIADYLSVRAEHAGEAVMTGMAVGFGGWLFTLAVAVIIGLVLSA